MAPRLKVSVPVKVWLEPRRRAGALELPGRVYSMFGQTANLSLTGIAFTVPSIRIEENYLVGDERVLNIELDLPVGRVSMKGIGRRYERLGDGVSCSKYVIGVHILTMSDEQRRLYEAFVASGPVSDTQAELLLSLDKN